MPATIRDVARLAGVSSAAVSKVLTNADNSIRVSEATSKRILRAARKLKYRPDIRARFLFQRRTQTIAFITDYSTLGTHYSHMTLSRCANQFLKHDHTTTVLFYDPQETETIERIQAMVEEGRFDGAILVSTDLPAIITSLERRDVPYIIVNPAHARRFDTIMFDEEDNLRLAFNCLLEAGHRHIGYLDYTKARDPHLTVSRRRDAYLRLCHEHHVPPYFFSEDFADVSG
ncbi:LacI family transcriptional regulator, partial [bacterium]|nr:LacI family transcriptional regulator [bacterium]